MADDFENDDRASRKPAKKSGDSTLKIVLIVFGSIAGLGILSCCGIGAAGYFWVQKNLGQANLTSAADIQKLTTEMTDITIPPEFNPKEGHSIFGIKGVEYEWCPTGNCPPRADGLGKLSLTSINLGDAAKGNPGMEAVLDSEFSDDVLKHQWKDYTKSEHEFTIRGKKCKFYIIQGEKLDFMDDSDEEATPGAKPSGENADGDEPNPEESAAMDESAPSGRPAAQGSGQKSVVIHGSFPGKQAECTLNIELAPDQYNEEIILSMLRSIR